MAGFIDGSERRRARVRPGVRLLLVVAGLCTWTAHSTAARSRIELELLPAVSRAVVGEPLVFQLRLMNTTADTLRFFFAPPGRDSRHDLRLRLRGPRGPERVLVPALLDAGLDPDTETVVLPPRGMFFAILAFRGAKPPPLHAGDWLIDRWECYTLRELAEKRRSSAREVPETWRCLERPGRYRITAELDLTPGPAVGLGRIRNAPRFLVERLEATRVELILERRRH
jgi:hypothetical protein